MKKHLSMWVVIGIGGAALMLAVLMLYSDFLGARVIRKGSPRLAVHRGQQVTLELAGSSQVRKLEICTEKKRSILSRSDFVDCRTLQHAVAPGVQHAEVRIPVDFPLERAVVITRVRGTDGKLLPLAPTDEKIALWVRPARAVRQPVQQQSEGGGGGGSGNAGGGSSASAPAQPAAVQQVSVDIQRVCVDPIDATRFVLLVRWYGPNTIVGYRIAGASEWQRPLASEYHGEAYTGQAGVQSVIMPGFVQSKTEYELRFEAGYGYPDPGNAAPSEVFRFNSGPASSPYCQNV